MWHLLNPFNIAKISIHAPRTGSDTPSPPTPSPARANFNPRSPHGERRPRAGRSCSALPFQSTLPARGATRPQPADAHGSRFQSTLPARGATRRGKHFFAICRFQSTLPARGATNPRRNHARQQIYFNPRSPHGERRARNQRTPTGADFNPRSPHGERHSIIDYQSAGFTISIHAPRTGSDVVVKVPICRAAEFQSTLPARGATSARAQLPLRPAHFNPRSPHGERPAHPLRATGWQHFNPRSPHGERLLIASSGWATPHFNPRSPHGERPAHPLRATGWQHFNPRSPHGERPRLRRRLAGKQRISIHAPRTGSDKESRLQGGKTSDFNPRSPHGERRQVMGVCRIPKDFNPRSPHGERPASASCPSPALLISIHAPRTGSDRRRRKSQKWTSRFQSTLPARGATAAKCHRKL